jgi:pimeloyl-ACP methyl ester carboxylesterase
MTGGLIAAASHFNRWILAWAIMLVPGPALTEIIHQQMGNAITINAEYLNSKGSGSPILILHGFLQTRDFFTVRRIGNALQEAGHRVLLPNLSLGINGRKQSLACEAIHNHSIQQDTSEIAHWVDWLYKKTGTPVTLIGHSSGSLKLTAYLDTYPSAPVEKSLLISLLAFGQGPIAKENPDEMRRAQADLARNDNTVHRYRLAYCDNYSTTPSNYLSYLSWDQKRTLQAISDMHKKPTIILGGEDKRLGMTWKQRLMSLNAHIIEINGANHFFDHTYEFDLIDSIESAL